MKLVRISVLLALVWLGSAFLSVTDTDLNNDTKLVTHKVFGNIEFGIPDVAPRLEKEKELVEEMGYAYFRSSDERVEITLNKMGQLDFDKIKRIHEGMAIDFYNGKVLQSEIVKVNNKEIFVIDIKGQWNGAGETIGMFRYYFNVGENSYNLLMRYPAKNVNKIEELKRRMLESVRIL